MYTITKLVNIKVKFQNPENLTSLLSFLHTNKIGGKWTVYNAENFDGTFPIAEALQVEAQLRELGIEQASG